MTDEFRVRASDELARLLEYWKTIELWIKKAEQVNGQAVIPAINELRYASRQLFQAVRLLQKNTLEPCDLSVIEKRLIIAHQYLLNADHDVCDAIISFFAENIKHLDSTYGVSEITTSFVEYPFLRERVSDCYGLIAGSRGEYNDRQKNYGEIRTNHFSHIIGSYQKLVDAEVAARLRMARLQDQVTIAQGSRDFLFWFTVGTGIITLISVPLAIYLWLNGPQSFCKRYSSNPAFGLVCSFAAPDGSSQVEGQQPAAHGAASPLTPSAAPPVQSLTGEHSAVGSPMIGRPPNRVR
jgi:hypothetical protein